MNRKEFIKKCSIGCLGAVVMPSVLQRCAGVKYLDAPIEGNELLVPLSSFVIEKEGVKRYHNYVVVENETLKFPICVYRLSENNYSALWMQCTHQGTELHVFGDRLQCPAHGSEFTRTGDVQNGPAADPLRKFPVAVSGTLLKISLR